MLDVVNIMYVQLYIVLKSQKMPPDSILKIWGMSSDPLVFTLQLHTIFDYINTKFT